MLLILGDRLWSSGDDFRLSRGRPGVSILLQFAIRNSLVFSSIPRNRVDIIFNNFNYYFIYHNL